jgi:hypothetical protein
VLISSNFGELWRKWLSLRNGLAHGILPTANLAQVQHELNSASERLRLLEQKQQELLDQQKQLKSWAHYRSITNSDQELISLRGSDLNSENSWARLQSLGPTVLKMYYCSGSPDGSGVVWVQDACELIEQLIQYVDVEVDRTATCLKAFATVRKFLVSFVASTRNFWSVVVVQRAWYTHHSAHPPDSALSSGLSSFGVCASPAL